VPSIAAGVVVSRASPGSASLSSVAAVEPRLRIAEPARKAGQPGRPADIASSRLAAVLSLSVIAAFAQLGERLPSPPARGLSPANRERSLAPKTDAARQQLLAASTCQHRRGRQRLKVLHIGSVHRRGAGLAARSVSRMATPSRPPLCASICQAAAPPRRRRPPRPCAQAPAPARAAPDPTQSCGPCLIPHPPLRAGNWTAGHD